MTDFSTEKRRTTKPNLNQQLMDVGKLPPQAIELEESVLGILMLETEAIQIANPIIETDSFYKDSNAAIFEAIVSLHNNSIKADSTSVFQELKRTGKLEIAGGAYRLTELTNKVTHGANLEVYCRIIAEKYIQRSLIKNSTILINKAYEEGTDVFDLLDEAEKQITQLTSKVITTKIDGIHSIYNRWLLHNEIIRNNKSGISGVASGFYGLDKLTGGWQKSDLVIIAARPAMGKTSLMLSMARNAAVDFKEPVAIFSVEMSKLQLLTRLMAQETGRNSQEYTRYGLQDDELPKNMEQCNALLNANIFIDDTPSLTVFEFRNKARKLVRDHNIKAIYVDYLQIMKTGEKSRGKTEDVGLISNALKAVAKELELPVIALSQLSRALEERGGDKRPGLSDLRNSGEIEQDADVVVFIHRPEYYGITEDEDGASTIGKAALICEKNRSGPIGVGITHFIASTTKFTDEIQFTPAEKELNELKGNHPNPNKLTESNKQEDDLPF